MSFESYETKTEDEKAESQKHINLIFLNTIFTLYISHIVVSSFNNRKAYEIWQEEGLLADSFGILVSYYFIAPLMQAIDLPWLILLVRRKRARDNIESGYII